MIYSGLIWLIEDNWIHQEISLWNCLALITYFQFFAKSANKMKIMYCALGPFQMSFVIKVHKQLKDRWLKFEFFINFNRHDYFLSLC